jgi:hypothetical protein
MYDTPKISLESNFFNWNIEKCKIEKKRQIIKSCGRDIVNQYISKKDILDASLKFKESLVVSFVAYHQRGKRVTYF